jgi:hypothetical protein|tara:strand:+ start:8692 stop:8973 length:282 start_codon:yes stop_codon:yes gene_type:complete
VLYAKGSAETSRLDMANTRIETELEEPDDLLMNDDVDFVDTDLEEEQEERSTRAKSFNLDMRHRIEDRLEERRLLQELNEYEFPEDDDDDTLH